MTYLELPYLSEITAIKIQSQTSNIKHYIRLNDLNIVKTFLKNR